MVQLVDIIDLSNKSRNRNCALRFAPIRTIVNRALCFPREEAHMIVPPVPSDSDSDWDDDDDFAIKKINIKINPIAPITPSKISASVDELRATVGTWKSLANVNLSKPNSRRHHRSTAQVNNSTILPDNLVFPNDETLSASHSNINERYSLHPEGGTSSAAVLNPKVQSAFARAISIPVSKFSNEALPIAFALQECLNAKFSPDGCGEASLFGRLKMAVPPHINEMDFSNRDLEVTFISTTPWGQINLNHEYMRAIDEHDTSNSYAPNDSAKRLVVDMKAIQNYTRKVYQKQTSLKYYLLPELVNYNIRSQEYHGSTIDNNKSSLSRVTPVHAVSHWLCDLNNTKVRVNVQFLKNTLSDHSLSTDDIKNLKITMGLSGGVVSYQSKPEASWNPLNSELTWSFTSLAELINKSTLNDVTSCMARFDLIDGPSTPSDVCLQFSMAGKTISGSHIILNNTKNFCLAKQKYHFRTGAFRCQPSCI